MSGHSKWSTIKRAKQANDIVRSQLFTKVAQVIGMAVKKANGDTNPESNFSLRLAIERAKSVNMPKENIDRVIKRASGQDKQAALLIEVTYEGFAAGNVAVMLEGVTDNKQRTYNEVKHVFSRNSGRLSGTGSVAYLFQKAGEIVVEKKDLTYDELLEICLACAVQELEETPDNYLIYTKPEKLHQVRELLIAKQLAIRETLLTYVPKTVVELTEQTEITKVLALLTLLDELADIHKVYANARFPDSFV